MTAWLSKHEDKIISINKAIPDAIGKSGGDTVTVTLHLLDVRWLRIFFRRVGMR